MSPVEVAELTLLFSTNVVPFVIEVIVGFGGLVVKAPAPEIATPIPTARPAVLSQVTVALRLVVAQFVSRTPAAVSVSAEPVPLAAWLITKVVEFVTELIVVATVPLVGVVVLTRFVPVSNMPGINPVVLAQVTVVKPLVVAQPVSTTAGVRLPVAPRCFKSVAARRLVVVHPLIAPASPLAVDPFEKISRKLGPVACAPVL